MLKLGSMREVAGYNYSYKLFHWRCHYHVRVYLTVGSLFSEVYLMQGGTHTTGKRNGSKERVFTPLHYIARSWQLSVSCITSLDWQNYHTVTNGRASNTGWANRELGHNFSWGSLCCFNLVQNKTSAIKPASAYTHTHVRTHTQHVMDDFYQDTFIMIFTPKQFS